MSINSYAAAIASLERERGPLAARLDTIDLALANLRLLVEDGQQQTAEPRATATKKATKATSKAHDADSPKGREDAILRQLRLNGGVATAKELRAKIPAYAAMGEEQGSKAFSNDAYRLKVAGKVARTGHTWSLVGVSEAAA